VIVTYVQVANAGLPPFKESPDKIINEVLNIAFFPKNPFSINGPFEELTAYINGAMVQLNILIQEYNQSKSEEVGERVSYMATKIYCALIAREWACKKYCKSHSDWLDIAHNEKVMFESKTKFKANEAGEKRLYAQFDAWARSHGITRILSAEETAELLEAIKGKSPEEAKEIEMRIRERY
jgi:hypothetical protein